MYAWHTDAPALCTVVRVLAEDMRSAGLINIACDYVQKRAPIVKRGRSLTFASLAVH